MARKVLQVAQPIGQQPPPAVRRVQPRKVADYPHLTAGQRRLVARYASPLLMGPPVCDELVALVAHLFTEHEAALVAYLGIMRGRTAAQIARAECRDVEEVARDLDRLADGRRVIVSSGQGAKRSYRLLPIMPGVFEMTLFTYTPETLTPWHRRFIELFEALYETGYAADYAGGGDRLVRVVPVGKAIEGHPLAVPSDHLAVVMDRFKVFAVGQCQCRTTQRALGRGCDRELANCMIMGQWAEQGIAQGWARPVEKHQALEIKRAAEADGMVNWIMNVETSKGQCSCSCCGCCCHAMRTMIDFSAPSLFAPPHFLPKIDESKCTHCGLCKKKCPLGAIKIECPAAKTGEPATPPRWKHNAARCVGCGLCAVACVKQRAIAMEAVPSYKLPYRSWFAALAGAGPKAMRTAWRVWRDRA